MNPIFQIKEYVMRKSIIGLPITIALAVSILAGCGAQSPKTYISKRGEYMFTYPAGWKYVDDERELTEAREAINTSQSSRMPFAFNPDVILAGSDYLGGMVIRSPQPLAAGELSDEEETMYLTNIEQMSLTGGVPAESWQSNINDKNLYFSIIKGIDGSKSLSALCMHNNFLYMFLFSCKEADFPQWRPVFEEFMSSINFKADDIAAAKGNVESAYAGFFTGLWHGALFPFRWMASYIWEIDVYADNSGRPYLIAFILGSMCWLPSICGPGRRRY